MSKLFVSDLHLDASRPAATDSFLELLSGPARQASSVFILGDLFEAWVGDDDDEPWLDPVLAALADLTDSGVSCAFMHGNRDFLIGDEFASATGVELLDDYATVQIDGRPILLTHGDLLCTDDTRYMTLRGQLRNQEWKAEFLSKPLAERRRIAFELRAMSKSEMAAKPSDIMDVNDETVTSVMREHGVTTLIHGHTHRPAFHRWSVDGEDAVRIVLGDWYTACSWLVWDGDGPHFFGDGAGAGVAGQ